MAALQGIGFCFNKYRVTNSPLSLGTVSIALQKESLDTYQASAYEGSAIKKKKKGKEGRGTENRVSASRADDDNREINSHYSFKSMYRLVTSATTRERWGRESERVGVCKGVSSGGKWPRLPRRCSQTIPFHHRRARSCHH